MMIRGKRHIEAEKDGEYSRQLLRIYEQIWSGDPADRPTAWFRTIQYLRREGYPEEMIVEAELRQLFESKKPDKRSYIVKSNGRLIRVNETSFMLHLN